jgi:hypothetical protein
MMFAGRGALVFFSGVLAFAGAPSALADTDASTVKLAPHRAVYDLKLTQSRGSQSMQGVNGRILYDFNGSSCEGYALQFRQVSELDAGEGKGALSDMRATTWEDGGATSFRFTSENTINQKQVESVDGRAERGAQGVAVNLTKPEAKKFDIAPGMVFPTEHLRRIIAAARDGKTILELPVFDGSENGEKVFNTLTVLGRPIPPDQRVPTDAAAGKAELAGLTRWPVTISYFEGKGSSGEQIPAYSITFELYDNGVSRALMLDYNDFILRGEMSSLEVKDPKPCK